MEFEWPEFEWDEIKRRSNIKRHGVDFFKVSKVFFGPLIERVDDREDYGEERIIAFGSIDGKVYRVVYTMRDHVIRIITAQEAEKNDEEEYYAQIYRG